MTHDHQIPRYPKKDAASAAAARAEFLADLDRTFSSAHGARVLTWLRTAAAVHAPAYTPGGSSNDALWRDGRKSVVLEIEANLARARAASPDPAPAATGKPAAPAGKRAARRKSG
jgi:hypothetical protein